MQTAIKVQREATLEQDKKTKDVLQFVADIGLDLLPKKATDQIIQEVKLGMILVPGLPLDLARLNLKNGTFGESQMELGTNQWKANLLKFLNKMISGSIDSPISIESHLSLS